MVSDRLGGRCVWGGGPFTPTSRLFLVIGDRISHQTAASATASPPPWRLPTSWPPQTSPQPSMAAKVSRQIVVSVSKSAVRALGAYFCHMFVSVIRFSAKDTFSPKVFFKKIGLSKKTPAEIEKVFKILDQDKSGYIEQDELQLSATGFLFFPRSRPLT